MSEENKRIREWLEGFKRFVDEASQYFIKKPSRKRLSPQIRKINGINSQCVEMGIVQLMKQRMQEGLFRMPFDYETPDELNVEKYELTKTGKITPS